MERGQLLCGLNGGHPIGNSRCVDRDLSGLIQFVIGESFVQKGKESFTAVVIMFPRVFTVQNDGDDDPFLRRLMDDVLQPPHDILGGGFGCRLVIDESECVGDLAVTEQGGQSMLGFTDAIGLIERGLPMPWAAAHSQGMCEDAFVRGKPAKAGLMDQRKHLGTHRSL